MTIGETIGILSGACGIIGFVYVAFARVAKMEFQVKTLWDYLMDRARTEVVTKGLGTVNSPIAVNEETRRMYDGMIGDLRAFYRRLGVKLSERELFIAITRQFGARITQEICIPYGLIAGSCIAIAVALAQET